MTACWIEKEINVSNSLGVFILLQRFLRLHFCPLPFPEAQRSTVIYLISGFPSLLCFFLMEWNVFSEISKILDEMGKRRRKGWITIVVLAWLWRHNDIMRRREVSCLEKASRSPTSAQGWQYCGLLTISQVWGSLSWERLRCSLLCWYTLELLKTSKIAHAFRKYFYPLFKTSIWLPCNLLLTLRKLTLSMLLS